MNELIEIGGKCKAHLALRVNGEDVEVAPISRNPNLDWLPAVEVRGEGLFFEFAGAARPR